MHATTRRRRRPAAPLFPVTAVLAALVLAGQAAPGQSAKASRKGRGPQGAPALASPDGGAGPEPLLTVVDPELTFASPRFSADGARVLACSMARGRHEIVVWNASTGRELVRLAGHAGVISAARFSPDGARVVSAGEDRFVRVWNATTGRELHALKVDGPNAVQAADISPDGARVAAAGPRKIHVWDAASGRPLRTADDDSGPTLLAFTADGKTLVTGGGSGAVKLRDAETLQERSARKPFGSPGRLVASRDGARVAGYDSGARATRVWDAATGKPAATLQGPQEPLRDLSFSPDGAKLVGTTFGGDVKFWDAATGQEALSVRPHPGSCYAAFSPDGTRLVTTGTGDRAVKVWDVATLGQPAPRRAEAPAQGQGQGQTKAAAAGAGHRSTVDCVAFSPDGARLASGAKDYTVKLWDAKTGRPVRTFEGRMAEVRSLAFSADGTRLAAVADAAPRSTDRVLRVWNLVTGREVLNVPGPELGDVAFSPDGKRLAATGPGSVLGLLDAVRGRPAGTIPADPAGLLAFAFSPDGQQVTTAGVSGVKVWDPARGRPVRALDVPAADRGFYAHAVVFSRDGRRLLRGVRDRLQVVDLETGQAVRDDIKPFPLPPAVANLSPDGKRVVCAGLTGKTLKVIDVETGRELATYEGQTSVVSAAAFSPDGARVFSGDSAGGLKLWEVETGREVFSADGAGPAAGVAARGGMTQVRVGDPGPGPDPGAFRPPVAAPNGPARRNRAMTPAPGAARGGSAAGAAPAPRLLVAGAEHENPSPWLYTTVQPPADWYAPPFRADGWKSGQPGFCSEHQGSIKKRTPWHSPSIWMRTTVDLPRAVPGAKYVLRVAHDDGLTVYLNGTQVYRRDGVAVQEVTLTDEQAALLHAGRNVLAARCVDTGGECGVDLSLTVGPKE